MPNVVMPADGSVQASEVVSDADAAVLKTTMAAQSAPQQLDPPWWRISAASAMATMGVLPVLPVEASPTPLPSTLGNIFGATAGGAIVGYVAAGTGRGAFTAALLTGGLAGLLDASLLMRRQEHRTLGGSVLVVSLVGLFGCFWLATQGSSKESGRGTD
jgi:hypothetical protein